MNDPPAEAVVRRIREEAGFETRVVKLAALYDRKRHPHPPMMFHVYKAFFLCEITGSGGSDGHETDDMESPERLPSLSQARVVQSQIARMFDHHPNPAGQTDFD